MKKTLFPGLILLALTVAFTTAPSNPLVGRWQQKFPDGDVMLANFRTDGTYDAFVNGKAFVSGKYTLRQSDFGMSDGLCNVSYVGVYKASFYSGTDSVRFTVVRDSCRARRRGTDGLTLGRVKPGKR